MNKNYRLYTFVAGLYLSDLQKGLQTAHVISEMFKDYNPFGFIALSDKSVSAEYGCFDTWAKRDKTIVICSAGNHAGVVQAYNKLSPFGIEFNLPVSIFREDEQSMNGMATACGIILPEEFYDVKFQELEEFQSISPAYVYRHKDEAGICTGKLTKYLDGSPEFALIDLVKSFRLA